MKNFEIAEFKLPIVRLRSLTADHQPWLAKVAIGMQWVFSYHLPSADTTFNHSGRKILATVSQELNQWQ